MTYLTLFNIMTSNKFCHFQMSSMHCCRRYWDTPEAMRPIAAHNMSSELTSRILWFNFMSGFFLLPILASYLASFLCLKPDSVGTRCCRTSDSLGLGTWARTWLSTYSKQDTRSASSTSMLLFTISSIANPMHFLQVLFQYCIFKYKMCA
jgi:hypothetical protein